MNISQNNQNGKNQIIFNVTRDLNVKTVNSFTDAEQINKYFKKTKREIWTARILFVLAVVTFILDIFNTFNK